MTANTFPWSPYLTPEMRRAFEAGASALVRAPVCPRCLDLVPGTPGGEPETPHPGPFTEGLCAACEKAVNLERNMDVVDRGLAAKGLKVDRFALAAQVVHNHGPIGKRVDVTGPCSISITNGKVEVKP